jgi:type IV pilus assembly protein PilE
MDSLEPHTMTAPSPASLARRRGVAGFTLIELMIVMAIVAILATIAYPSYRESVAKGNRAQAVGELMGAHQWMERFYSENFRYDQSRSGTAVTAASQFPSAYTQSPRPGEGNAKYLIAVTASAQQSYTVTATRTGSMTGDACGNLTINHLGRKGVAAGSFNTAQYANEAAAVAACWRQ